MKITFHKLRFKNLLSTGNEFESFDLEENPFTVIVGKNGSGKSTILDAMSYVLFKKPYRKINLNQLINTKNKKGLLVEIAFSVGSSSYVVRRGEKPKIFEIYRDKKLIEADPSISDMQDYLETNILRQNFKTFCQINLIGKATYTQFMSLPAANRREIVENILDSDIYTIMQGLAKDDVKEMGINLTSLENEISILKNKLDVTKSLIAQSNMKRDSEIEECREQISNREADMNSRNKNISDITFHIDSFISSKEQLESELNTIIPDYSKYEIIRDKIHGEYSALTLENDKKKKMISNMSKLETCPHCYQNVDESHKSSITNQLQSEIEESQKKIDDLNIKKEKLTRVHNQYKEVKERVTSLTEKLWDHNSKLNIYKNDINNFKEEISRLEAKIKKLQEPTELPDDIESPDNIQLKINENTSKRDDLITEIDHYKQAIKLLGDGGIKAYLIDKYIPIINKTINDYLESMNLFVDFQLDNQFNETIKANYLDTYSYESFSEGQKMRIDLAILLAWRQIGRMRNSMSTNILFLDEVADGSLDADGMVEFLGILKSGLDADNVFLISHKDSTIDMFENTIKVEMGRDGFSKYTKV